MNEWMEGDMVTTRGQAVRAQKSNVPARITKSRSAKSASAAKGTKQATSQGKKARKVIKARLASPPMGPTLTIVAPAVFDRGRTTDSPPSANQVSETAKVVRAQRELVDLAFLRLIYQAVRARTSQSAIAQLLGTSQPTVSRIARQIEQDPTILESSPREVINRRTVGELDTGTMISTLLSYSYTPGRFDPTGADGFLRGDWRQIENALVAGLITDEEYERIAREAPARKLATTID